MGADLFHADEGRETDGRAGIHTRARVSTTTTKLPVAFRNFTNASKNRRYVGVCLYLSNVNI
jgi:hypothetical protein